VSCDIEEVIVHTHIYPKKVNVNNSVRGVDLSGRSSAAIVAAGAAVLGLSGALLSPAASAADGVGGKIGDEYVAAAEANGQTPEQFFGAPTSPEQDAANGGKFQTFETGQTIYWNPNVSDGNANQVGGAILERWDQATMNGSPGREQGSLHYPTSREWPAAKSGASGTAGRGNHFEDGSIYWGPDTGAHIVWGLVRDAYWHLDGESSVLGLPVGEESFDGTVWEQAFEGGHIFVSADGLAGVSVGDKEITKEPVPIDQLHIG